MEIGKTLYVANRREWRAWLRKNYKKERDIWLIYYKKDSGKPRIPYNDAVEEALCFGWIDSIIKKMDAERFVQRFSKRNKPLVPANNMPAGVIDKGKVVMTSRRPWGLGKGRSSRPPSHLLGLRRQGRLEISKSSSANPHPRYTTAPNPAGFLLPAVGYFIR